MGDITENIEITHEEAVRICTLINAPVSPGDVAGARKYALVALGRMEMPEEQKFVVETWRTAVWRNIPVKEVSTFDIAAYRASEKQSGESIPAPSNLRELFYQWHYISEICDLVNSIKQASIPKKHYAIYGPLAVVFQMMWMTCYEAGIDWEPEIQTVANPNPVHFQEDFERMFDQITKARNWVKTQHPELKLPARFDTMFAKVQKSYDDKAHHHTFEIKMTDEQERSLREWLVQGNPQCANMPRDQLFQFAALGEFAIPKLNK